MELEWEQGRQSTCTAAALAGAFLGTALGADCIQGTVSKVYDPRTVPGAKVQKGVACHVLPGKVELNVMITWSKSYYVARKHGSMQAHFTFEAMPGRSYAAVFNVKDSSAKIISLDAG